MDITMNPDFSIVTRWKNSIPQYIVGHKQRLALIQEQIQKELPGVFLAGASYGGVGIPDCIDQGEAAVQRVLEYLKAQSHQKLFNKCSFLFLSHKSNAGFYLDLELEEII